MSKIMARTAGKGKGGEIMNYSKKAGGNVKHINSENGIITLCGLEIESMYSITQFESVQNIKLPLCKKCEKVRGRCTGGQ